MFTKKLEHCVGNGRGFYVWHETQVSSCMEGKKKEYDCGNPHNVFAHDENHSYQINFKFQALSKVKSYCTIKKITSAALIPMESPTILINANVLFRER